MQTAPWTLLHTEEPDSRSKAAIKIINMTNVQVSLEPSHHKSYGCTGRGGHINHSSSPSPLHSPSIWNWHSSQGYDSTNGGEYATRTPASPPTPQPHQTPPAWSPPKMTPGTGEASTITGRARTTTQGEQLVGCSTSIFHHLCSTNRTQAEELNQEG